MPGEDLDALRARAQQRLRAREKKAGWDGPATLRLIAYSNNIATTNHSLDPNDYLKATGEALWIIMGMCFFLVWVFNPDHLESNPIRDAIGYNNACVAWGVYPSRYVGAVLYVFIPYCALSYASVDSSRADLNPYLSKKQRTLSEVVNAIWAVSSLLGALLFVITPGESGDKESRDVHFALYANLIPFRYFAVVANFLLTDEYEVFTRPQKFYLFYYGVTSLSLCVVGAYAVWKHHPGEEPIVEPKVLMFLEYSWWVCLPLTTWIMPVQGQVGVKRTFVNPQLMSHKHHDDKARELHELEEAERKEQDSLAHALEQEQQVLKVMKRAQRAKLLLAASLNGDAAPDFSDDDDAFDGQVSAVCTIGGLRVHADGKNYKKRPGWDRIICPCLSAMYCNGDLPEAEAREGLIMRHEMRDAMRRMGYVSNDKLDSDAFLDQFQWPINLFALEECEDRQWNTGLRNPLPHPEKIERFLSHADEQQRFREDEMVRAVTYFEEKRDVANDRLDRKDMCLVSYTQGYLAVFGRDDGGGLFATRTDLRRFMVDSRYPNGWKPREQLEPEWPGDTHEAPVLPQLDPFTREIVLELPPNLYLLRLRHGGDLVHAEREEPAGEETTVVREVDFSTQVVHDFIGMSKNSPLAVQLSDAPFHDVIIDCSLEEADWMVKDLGLNLTLPPQNGDWSDVISDESLTRLFFYDGGSPFLHESGRGFAADLKHLADSEARPGFLPYGCRLVFDARQHVELIHIYETNQNCRPGDPQWDDAKRIARQSFRMASLLSHYVDVNLVCAYSMAASAQQLPPGHSLQRLVHLFTCSTFAVANNVKELLLPEGSLVHRASGLTHPSLLDLVAHQKTNSMIFKPFPEWLSGQRQLARVTQKGRFPFLFDGLQLFGVIRRFVQAWVNKGEDWNDEYGQQFYKCLKRFSLGSKYCLPPFTKPVLIDTLTQFIFAVTGLHECYSSGGGGFRTDIRGAGLRARSGMEQTDVQSFLLDLVLFSGASVAMPPLLGEYRQFLGVAPGEPWELQVWQDFQRELQDLTRSCDDKNHKRKWAFPHFCPANLQTSVVI